MSTVRVHRHLPYITTLPGKGDDFLYIHALCLSGVAGEDIVALKNG